MEVPSGVLPGVCLGAQRFEGDTAAVTARVLLLGAPALLHSLKERHTIMQLIKE